MSNFGGQSPTEHSCIIISKLMNRLRKRSLLKVFLFLALGAILFNVAESFEQVWERVTQETFLYNYFEIQLFFQKVFLFLALAATLFNIAERFEQFWWTVTLGTFLYHYFKIDELVKEEKSFKGFSIFSSGSHLVISSGTV